MPRLLRSGRARQDLIEIWRYVAKHDLAAADRLLDRIEEVSQVLARNPRLGVARPDIRPGFRHFPVASYIVLYRTVDGGIEIARVVHGRRDLLNLP